jgi:site-specific DNA-adenine methylase
MSDKFTVSGESINEDVDRIFKFYRVNGFPHYKREDYIVQKELQKIIDFDENKIFNNNELGQTMHGLGFLWTFFPHWTDVKYKGQDKSLMDLWNDDNKLKELVVKTYKWQLKHGNGKFTVNRIRQNAKVYCAKQSVSNFRPTAAKFIYNKFGNKGTVWDMSCGWGGRLLGFMASNCTKYIGTEPSTLTYKGLVELKDVYSINKEIELFCCGSEQLLLEPDSVDLCFTSPPYYDNERYCEEKTQSFKSYPTKEYWVNDYLKKTINNCKRCLKKNSYMIINIANTPSCNWLESKILEISKQQGFVLSNTYKLVLSSIAGKGKKYEPVFIFKNDK